jgi:RNA polymerase sigma factor (sigma-70 family)
MNYPSDQELLQLLQSGEPALQDNAFRYLYRQYYGLVESIVTQNNGNADDAKDVFHDGLIVLFNNVKKEGFHLSATLKTYLYSICRNLWLMKLRKGKKETPLQDHHEHIPLSENIFDTLLTNERKELVVRLLKKLGDDCRRLIELFYFHQMKMAKLMEVFQLGSEQAAKNKKSNCMKKLREMARGIDGLNG